MGIPKQLSSGIEVAQVTSPRSSRTGGEIEYATFYPDGTAEDFEVYLRSPSGRVFLLSVTEATGRTLIRELAYEEMVELGLEVSQ